MIIRIPDEIFGIKKYDATVVSNNNVASFIKELRLKLDAGQKMDFETGSYVQLDIPEYERSYREIYVGETYKKVWDRFDFWGLKARGDEPVYRAYSMANTPAEDSASVRRDRGPRIAHRQSALGAAHGQRLGEQGLRVGLPQQGAPPLPREHRALHVARLVDGIRQWLARSGDGCAVASRPDLHNLRGKR